MIIKKTTYGILCDNCGEFFEASHKAIEAAEKYVFGHGWVKHTPKYGRVQHFCSSCWPQVKDDLDLEE